MGSGQDSLGDAFYRVVVPHDMASFDLHEVNVLWRILPPLEQVAEGR